jgi:hypothetical protein
MERITTILTTSIGVRNVYAMLVELRRFNMANMKGATDERAD